MGLFSKKKKENFQVLNNVMPLQQDLPEFPELDDNTVGSPPTPEFPNYESSITNIKNAVEEEQIDEDFKIPERNDKNSQKVMANVQPTNSTTSKLMLNEDKPLFVKIEKYKDVLHHIKLLKEKLEEAENTLKTIDEIRTHEEQKIEDWKNDIQSIKEKLLSIDSKLSEV